MKDRDVCSSLLPSEVMNLCKEAGVKSELTNESHLVVSIWFHGECIERVELISSID